jgi:hypothetical protein
MSRSRKKHLIVGVTTAESEKYNKRVANRNMRRKVKSMLKNGNCDKIPLIREISNVWLFAKDGKSFWNDVRASRK